MTLARILRAVWPFVLVGMFVGERRLNDEPVTLAGLAVDFAMLITACGLGWALAGRRRPVGNRATSRGLDSHQSAEAEQPVEPGEPPPEGASEPVAKRWIRRIVDSL